MVVEARVFVDDFLLPVRFLSCLGMRLSAPARHTISCSFYTGGGAQSFLW